MTNTISNSALAWLLTYAIHSTVLLGLAWAATRRAATSPAARDFIWKVALVGGVVTATVQLEAGFRPSGSVSLVPAATMKGDQGESAAQLAQADVPATIGVAKHLREPVAPVGVSDVAPVESAPLATTASTAAAPTAATASAGSLTTGTIAVWAWAIAAFVLSVGYLARRLILVGRLGDRRAVTDGPLPEMLAALCRASGRRVPVRLTCSSAISSPVALGLREICVPDAALTDLDADQQRGLLAHELAHLARRDPLWLDAAGVIERVFFFQPLNRLARRELQQAAEYLCDDWAAARMGSGVPLAKCLARVAEWIQASPLGVPVAGMAEQRSLLVARIARLIEGRASVLPAPKFVFAGAALVLLTVIVAAAPGVQGTPQVATKPDSQSKDTDDRDRFLRVSRRLALLAPHVPGSVHVSPRLAGPPINTPPGLLVRPSRLAGPPRLAGEGRSEEPVDSAVVLALVERLKDTDAGVRRAAASSLGNLGSRLAVPGLIAALADKDREVREAVVGALGDLQDERAIAPLSDLLSDPSADVRERALDALSNFSKNVNAGPVVHALYDQNADIRQKAAHLLGEIGDQAAAGPVAGLLHDSNADVRQAALDALREMKAKVSERTMLEMLGDQSADVRQVAVEMVSDHPFPDAVAALRRLLDDPELNVRLEAVSALGEIGDPKAREALRAALASKDAKVRQRAAEVLGERR